MGLTSSFCRAADAKTPAPSPVFSAAQMPALQALCADSFTDCIQQVDHWLPTLPVRSLYWRELTLLKLESMFSLQRGADVLALTTELIQQGQWPANFLARVYIYHGKELHAAGRTLEAKHYIDKVSELLKSFHDADGLPLTELRLINVRMYIDGNRQAAYNDLKSMVIRYDATHDWDLRFSVYHNLAHVAEFLDKTDETWRYRRQAMQIADEGPNAHYKALTRYYLTRFALAQGQFDDEYYGLMQQAEGFASDVGADFLQVRCHLLQVELAYRQQRYAKAQTLFAELSPAALPADTQEDYAKVQALLAGHAPTQ